jgi:signal transduction histidine kinase
MLTLILFLCAGVTFAAAKGTAKEAKALVAKAIAFYNSNGKDHAFAEFNNPKGKFVDRDLYVMVMDYDGNMLSHGANAKLIGKNLLDLKDSDGTPMVREFIRIAKSQGSGWADYKWTNPTTKKIEKKSSYVQKLSNNTFIVCGIYK